jgi:hypothetical protein
VGDPHVGLVSLVNSVPGLFLIESVPGLFLIEPPVPVPHPAGPAGPGRLAAQADRAFADGSAR